MVMKGSIKTITKQFAKVGRSWSRTEFTSTGFLKDVCKQVNPADK